MDRISLTVRIPCLCQTREFIAPATLSVGKIKGLIVDILTSEYGITANKREYILVDKNDGKILRNDCNLSQMEISDGSELIIF